MTKFPMTLEILKKQIDKANAQISYETARLEEERRTVTSRINFIEKNKQYIQELKELITLLEESNER